MNHKFIVEKALVYGGIGVVVSLCVGTLAGVFSEHRRLRGLQRFKFHMPENVKANAEVFECFVTLATAKKADFNSLERAGRRCGLLTKLLTNLLNAEASSVRSNYRTVASEAMESFRKYLHTFYLESHVPLVKCRIETGPDLVPVNSEMAHAHVTLLQLAEGIVHEIQKTVTGKQEELAFDA